MHASHSRSLLVALFMTLVSAGCGDDDDDTICDQAWEKSCACPNVSCDGHPASCSGPDKEWAQCIMEADNACTAKCR